MPRSRSRFFVFVGSMFFACLCVFLCQPNIAALAQSPTDWPQWRGRTQNGAVLQSLPTEWSEDDGIGWKIKIPGFGGSTPVTAGSSAFFTAGVDGLNMLLSIDTETGDVNWKQSVGKDLGKKHKKGGGSNPSVITDGQHVYAFFRSGDLGCFDLDGTERWKTSVTYDVKDGLWWDLGTSPILTNNAVVISVQHSGPSYLVAFDKKTGKELWKADRNLDAPKEAAQSYTTPANVIVNGQDAIATVGADHLTLHRATDGKELGRLGGFNPTADGFFRSISSPVAEDNIVICPYARGASVTAVNMDQLANGKGNEAIVWFRDDLGSDVPTPALQDGRVYFISDGKTSKGKVSCVSVSSGKTIWEVQVPKSRAGFTSSPLVAGDHLYVTQENAVTHVIGPLSSDTPEIIASNKIDDDEQFTVASPIPNGDALLLRSKHSLYRITGK